MCESCSSLGPGQGLEGVIIYRSPHHVSGFWVPYRHEDPELMGSLGVGILLEPGMEARSCRGCSVSLDGVCIEMSVAQYVFERLGVSSCVNIRSTVPPGVGGAVSAFASISLACEAMRIRGHPCTSREALLEASRAAHYAEVRALTGLGDVIAMLTGGGLVMRLRPGAPGFGHAIAIDDPSVDGFSIVLGIVERILSTPNMLRGMWDSIYNYGSIAYRFFQDDPGFLRFLELSNMFSRNTGFLDRDLAERFNRSLSTHMRRGVVAGYYVKKSLLVVAVEKGYEGEIVEILEKVVKRVLGVYRIARKGYEAVWDGVDTPRSSQEGVSTNKGEASRGL